MITKINVNGIEANIVKKSIKNIYIKISNHDGGIRISAPIKMKIEEIKKFVLSKIYWIKNQQEKIKKKRSYNYINNETHYFRGESYNLRLVSSDSAFVKLKEKEIFLYTPSNSIVKERESIMNNWYKNELFLLIPPLIKKWEKILNVSVDNFFVRIMKTRWGSCTPKTRRIRFNLDLAKASPEILEYIVVHELIHLIEASHNRNFKKLMDQYYPKWKQLKKELNNFNFKK